jgi:predicted  nucleic acid-binding Zn-ribbon protein
MGKCIEYLIKLTTLSVARMNASERLADTHVKLTAAQAKVEKARKASESAAAFASEIQKEVEALEREEREIATSRATAVKVAIAAGEAPKLVDAPELSALGGKLVDARNRLACARIAASELDLELREAESAVDAAKSEVAGRRQGAYPRRSR